MMSILFPYAQRTKQHSLLQREFGLRLSLLVLSTFLTLCAAIVPTISQSKLHSTSRRELLTSIPAAALSLALVRATNLSPLNVKSGSSWLATPGAQQLPSVASALAAQNTAAAAAAAAARAAYARDGVAVVRGVVSYGWIQLLRDAAEEAQDDPGESAQYLGAATDAATFFTDLEMARRLPSFAAFALHGPCAAVAAGVTQSNSVRYLYDQLFVKEHGVTLPTPWHQDGGYWRVKGAQLSSVFVPLDPVSTDNCLSFVPGSHRWPLHNPMHFADGTQYSGTSLPQMPDVDAMVAAGAVNLKQFELQPGDVLVFSSSTVHGGRGNWGRALSTRWAGDDCTFWARPGEGAVPTGQLNLRDGDPLRRNPAAFPLAWHAQHRA
uniref:Phytanoyl-CoA dioxygenase n=1 Tax=Chrysotila carterae TaxID=13221 RepID=A0A7S4F237_CHRCT